MVYQMTPARVCLRSAVLGVLFLASLLSTSVAAPRGRDGWEQLKNRVNFELYLDDHSLKDAPITSEERAEIYARIDDKSAHEMFRDNQRAEERRIVFSASVGLITLAANRSRQILVRGPREFCGGTGNCPLWIFMRQTGNAKLLLILEDGEGNGVFAGTGSYQGFTDLVVSDHLIGDETGFVVYRWNGTEYKRIDCYSEILSTSLVHDCPAPPR